MAWNPSPKVCSARDIANKYGLDKVIIFMIDNKAGTMETASYGKTKRECEEARVLAECANDAIMASYESDPL